MFSEPISRAPRVFSLTNRTLAVDVLPAVGGKVAQIRRLPSQRSLLIPPQAAYRTIPTGEKWVNFDTSGMDDCFPNIDEGPYPFTPWRGTPMPQMGEWVYGSWNVAELTERQIALERVGSILPYRVRKTIALSGDDGIRFDYRVENTGRRPFRYIWAAHPLLSIGDDYRVCLPAGSMPFVTFPPELSERQWPSYSSVDLSREWIPQGTSLKVFVKGLPEAWCELQLPGCTVRFEWHLARAPVLGIWFNNFGFPAGGRTPFRCIAIEPCTSASDVLHALDPADCPEICPAGTAEWSLSIRIATDPARDVGAVQHTGNILDSHR